MVESLKARVKNGRLVLDEPTNLPEGEVVELVPADTADMDDEERAALNESLAVSIDQMRKGQLIDGDEVLARLRARRELVPLDEVRAGDDELTDEERSEIRAELEASLAEANEGNLIDADVALAELRAMK
jgi:hypothetical protein